MSVDTLVIDPRTRLFRALADEGSIGLLSRLGTEPCTPQEVAFELGVSVSTARRHLNALHEAGLLTARKDGRATRFALAHPAAISGLLRAATDLVTLGESLLPLEEHLADA